MRRNTGVCDFNEHLTTLWSLVGFAASTEHKPWDLDSGQDKFYSGYPPMEESKADIFSTEIFISGPYYRARKTDRKNKTICN